MSQDRAFKRVILYARQYRANEGIRETLHNLERLFQKQGFELAQDEETAACFKLDLPVLHKSAMDPKRDLIVVVGGDGSLLSAARMAVQVDLPVIGINRGRLGFLTDISPKDLEHKLLAVLAGDFQEESRFLMEIQVWDQQTQHFEAVALNDLVLSRGIAPHLVDFSVYVDQQFVSQYRSDGLIVSTPTGSTAYALSAGGPIMHPNLNAMVIVPMFSHSLSSRPLVLDGDVAIHLELGVNNEADLQISCDGHALHAVKASQSIRIQKHKRRLRLLHPRDYQYYDTLRIKLGWSS